MEAAKELTIVSQLRQENEQLKRDLFWSQKICDKLEYLNLKLEQLLHQVLSNQSVVDAIKDDWLSQRLTRFKESCDDNYRAIYRHHHQFTVIKQEAIEEDEASFNCVQSYQSRVLQARQDEQNYLRTSIDEDNYSLEHNPALIPECHLTEDNSNEVNILVKGERYALSQIFPNCQYSSNESSRDNHDQINGGDPNHLYGRGNVHGLDSSNCPAINFDDLEGSESSNQIENNFHDYAMRDSPEAGFSNHNSNLNFSDDNSLSFIRQKWPRRAVIWSYFMPSPTAPAKEMLCKLCGLVVKHGNMTTNLHIHFKNHHPAIDTKSADAVDYDQISKQLLPQNPHTHQYNNTNTSINENDVNGTLQPIPVGNHVGNSLHDEEKDTLNNGLQQKRAIIWSYFLVSPTDPTREVTCKICGTLVRHGNITTNLHVHFKNHHPQLNTRIGEGLDAIRAAGTYPLLPQGVQEDPATPRKRALIWSYFVPSPVDPSREVSCKLCGAIVKHGNITTNLHVHFKNHHPNVNARTGEVFDVNPSLLMPAPIITPRSSQSDEDASGPSTGERRTKRAAIWTYFVFVSENEYKCKLCHKVVRINNEMSSNLHIHFKHNHPSINSKKCDFKSFLEMQPKSSSDAETRMFFT